MFGCLRSLSCVGKFDKELKNCSLRGKLLSCHHVIKVPISWSIFLFDLNYNSLVQKTRCSNGLEKRFRPENQLRPVAFFCLLFAPIIQADEKKRFCH